MRHYHAPRYSAVSWLDTQDDLRAAGQPFTIERDEEIIYGILVQRPFGPGQTLLKVHMRHDLEVTAWEEASLGYSEMFISVPVVEQEDE